MLRRIGTRALKCKHDKLIGVERCEECDSCWGREHQPVINPFQHLGMSIQAALELARIPIAHNSTCLFPVWAGTMEDMGQGRMVFGLQTNDPREDYEGPRFQLVVSLKIKYVLPWWRRWWNWLTRHRPEPWMQHTGYHYRTDKAGDVRKVIDSKSPGYTLAHSKTCPNCGSDVYFDHSSFEEGLGGGVDIRACRQCHCVWYQPSVVAQAS